MTVGPDHLFIVVPLFALRAPGKLLFFAQLQATFMVKTAMTNQLKPRIRNMKPFKL